jgi:hypothetical protein
MKQTGEHYPGTDRLTAEGRHELHDSDFGLPHERKFPMPDAAHVRAAESYFHYADDSDKPLLARNILRKADEFGVHVGSENVLRWADK